ncbi:MAG: tetratricopeptide repeat protein [Alphaproteobacteria bacterium]|nr:tetratricopeptide repeat protein [Alphaproteobacteria bacterium]
MSKILYSFRAVLSASALAIILSGCGTTQTSTPTISGLSEAVEPSLRQAAREAEASYDYRSAVQHYRALLDRHPDDQRLALSLARNLRFSGASQGAIDLLNSLAGSERSALVLAELGKAYLAADRLGLALRTLQEAQAKAPKNWEIVSALGVAYDYQEQWDKAQAAYLTALAINPDNPVVLNNLGLSRAQSGDLDGALDALRQANEQPAAKAQVRQNYALLLALKGDVTAAERMARKDLTAEQAKGNGQFYRQLAMGLRGY